MYHVISVDELAVDDPRRSLLGLVFGLPSRTRRGADDFPINIDLDAELELTSPLHPPLDHPLDKFFSQHVEMVRSALITGTNREEFEEGISADARTISRIVRDQIAKYATLRVDGNDHLYVLEFQGLRQYIKFGRTQHLYRRVSDHLRAAHLHGYALLNGWASPGVEDAWALERPAIIAAEWMHGASRERERFFDMPFKQALSIARAAYELRAR